MVTSSGFADCPHSSVGVAYHVHLLNLCVSYMRFIPYICDFHSSHQAPSVKISSHRGKTARLFDLNVQSKRVTRRSRCPIRLKFYTIEEFDEGCIQPHRMDIIPPNGIGSHRRLFSIPNEFVQQNADLQRSGLLVSKPCQGKRSTKLLAQFPFLFHMGTVRRKPKPPAQLTFFLP